MHAMLVTIHLISCFIMLAAVLLQSGKGAEMGAAFGGASQTLFGARGPATFLSKLTVGAAVVFMLTSLGLGIVTRESSLTITPIPVQQQASPTPSPPSPQPSPSKGTPEGSRGVEGKGEGLSKAPAPAPALPQVSPAHEEHSAPSTPPGAAP